MGKIKSFLLQCRRVWHALRKPSRQEFQSVAKISAIGIALLGVIGFIVSMLMKSFA